MKTKKIVILSFGLILGIGGVYAAWLDSVGRYEELGALLILWLPLQTPVYIVSLLLLSLFGVSHSILLFYSVTFIWWFLLGCFLAFIPIFFIRYFEDTYIE